MTMMVRGLLRAWVVASACWLSGIGYFGSVAVLHRVDGTGYVPTLNERPLNLRRLFTPCLFRMMLMI
jgi:hypothetical protein